MRRRHLLVAWAPARGHVVCDLDPLKLVINRRTAQALGVTLRTS